MSLDVSHFEYFRTPSENFSILLPFFFLFCFGANFIEVLFLWLLTQPPNLGRCPLKCISSKMIILLAPTRLHVILKLTATEFNSYRPPASLSRGSPFPSLTVPCWLKYIQQDLWVSLTSAMWMSCLQWLPFFVLLVKITIHRMQIFLLKHFTQIFPQGHHLLTGP